MNDPSPITQRDRQLAKVCLHCPVCRHARRNQQGLAFWMVKNVEDRVCPICQAYEKVYGRKAHVKGPEPGESAPGESL